jgi:hypothetical protein
LDGAGSGPLRLAGLASPPYSREALDEAAAAFVELCRVEGRSTATGLAVDIEVLPQHADRGREVQLSFLNHLLELSIRRHFQCR